MAAERGARYEPLPRWGHVTVSLDGKVFMWGGRTEDFSEAQQKKVSLPLVIMHPSELRLRDRESGQYPLSCCILSICVFV